MNDDHLPRLPRGRAVELPGRGTTFVREVAGPPGAPVVMLLHGLAATAALNWFPTFDPLGRRYRVVALDQRGHGKGIRSPEPFRLVDAADDVVALADVLGVERFIPIGYSMGGPIAQLCWLRHRERVRGLVLCATSRNFRGHPRDQLMFASLPLATLALRAPGAPTIWARAGQLLGERFAGPPLKKWAQADVRAHDRRAIVEAAAEIGRFNSRDWVGAIDVPTSVIVHTRDQLVPVRRQWKLAQSIPGAEVFVVEGDHFVVARDPGRFVPALLEATASVVRRSVVSDLNGGNTAAGGRTGPSVKSA